jgi:hypothetical protein
MKLIGKVKIIADTCSHGYEIGSTVYYYRKDVNSVFTSIGENPQANNRFGKECLSYIRNTDYTETKNKTLSKYLLTKNN